MSKKLILFIAFLITSFVSIVNITPVNAEEYTGQAIWPSEFISNVYIKKVKPDGSGKYQQGRFMRRSEDNAFVYCLQPFADIDNNLPYYNIARSDYAVYLNMTEEQWDKISLIAYYGYGYGNHQEHKWYAITQVMIWRVADPTTDFYFTNTLNGTRNDSLFVSEIEEIQNLVNNHYRIPKFSSQKISIPLGQSTTINDSNNILNEFTISKTSNVSASVNGNNLTITATGIGNGYIQLKKQDSIYTTPPIAYFSNHSQNVMRVGSFDPIVVDLKLEVMGGKVEIQKVDSKTLLNKAQGNATLKGAVYGVFKMDGTKIAELITDSNGYAKSDYLSSVGKLYIQELKASEGYKLDPNKYEIEISETNLEPSIQVKEEIIEGKIKISKYDSETNACKAQGEASLIGAKYQVINSNGEVVDTLTIGEDCTAVSKNLPYGNYKIVETDSSKGYLIDNNSYNVFINSETTFNVISKEDVIKGKIKISKYDSENNFCKAQGSATLKGAIYEIFDIRGNLVDTLTIGEDCTALSKNLPYGNYNIKEKYSSKGYLLDVNIYNANITENKIIDIVSKEDVIKNRISILKQYDYVDGTTQFLNAEANVTFEIYAEDGSKYASITTDKNGYASLEIPYGTWKFHQVNTTSGYEKIYDFYITIDENSEKEHYYNILNNALSAYLQILKLDTETGNKIELSDTTFKILNLDTNQYVSQYVGGKVISEFKTDENGIVITPLKLSSGNYKIIEIRSPKGYLINKEGLTFTIGNDTHFNYTTYGSFVTVEYKNSPIKGQIEIIKKGESFVIDKGTYTYKDILLDGIIYNIYAAEDIKSSDGKYIYYNKNDLVDTITTDKNGYGISKKLPLGKYYLIEVKTKDDYVLDSSKYYFELTEKNNTTPIVFELFEGFNYLKKGNLKFTKTDLVSDEGLPNTLIEIYNDKDELIFTGRTDENGKIIIENIPLGKYYILEKEAPEGYLINPDKMYFEITENGQVVKANMKDKIITGSLEFTKTDLVSDEGLPNTLIEIYNDNDELIFTGRTDENGKIIIPELKYGKYYILEKEAPEGYLLNPDKMYFEITEDGKIVKANMKDKLITGSLEFTKTDLVSDETLPNTLIEIYNDKDELVFTGRTDENGKIIIPKLKYGKYYILEKEAPEGYLINPDKMYFEITEDGKIVKANMKDEKEIEVPNTLQNENYFVEVGCAILCVLGIGVVIYANKKSKK